MIKKNNQLSSDLQQLTTGFPSATLEIADCVQRIMLITKNWNLDISMYTQKMLRNITMSEWTVLGYIFKNSQASMHELARYTYVSMPSMTETIAKLQKADLIKRCHDKNDRRKIFIRLTSKGKKLMEVLQKKHLTVLNNLLHNFNKNETRKLLDLLQNLLHRLEHNSSRETDAG
ncbi:MAG TPA: MarR family transcriptional regulator [Spirochaetota bacterium]|nr:MarR family transcriptional regulator [Spirochaetota bacterium]